MAGIYLHIPFCKTRCAYCDFYSTTQTGQMADYVRALCRELEMRAGYLQGAPVETVYLGGGTPSQLGAEELHLIFETLERVYGLGSATEITLEANPDDLTEEYVAMLRGLPVNRLSMGIQTFHDDTLRLLCRRHTARQAVEAVERCRRADFGNLSIDLIYGLPGETEERWRHDLGQALALSVEHISAYHLTYEPGTRLYALLQAHRLREVSEENSFRFFALLMDTMAAAGYQHYEISNFCLPGCHSRHNSAYWQGIPYLGCGASAHSYDGTSREWNASDLAIYIIGIGNGQRPFERELLDLPTRYNEYVMTSLRTRRGLSPRHLAFAFGTALHDYCLRLARPYLRGGKLAWSADGNLCLTRDGIFVSDGIISDLMYVE